MCGMVYELVNMCIYTQHQLIKKVCGLQLFLRYFFSTSERNWFGHRFFQPYSACFIFYFLIFLSSLIINFFLF